ncbi:succinate dehydrogenase cytochrome b subunit [Luteolibacter pohnpeiensis]|uniref:Succinate dehydrogenase cytochrome b subunit n=1 Tax=Luteolibacter pohnpeiensis TaxID=454153 RepID=A0A934S8L7_9BACT|nr:succinate dehydrogenase cytochrome b subunit [Luteolibacter pohnpeiensis]MBK1883350.1 succinate dehydrogenase cytochrome b subunit [Luteolibacter pohnpeiensis]
MNALTRSFSAIWNSSLGKKYIVALTGIVLFLFLAGHLIGNLLVFVGREAFNSYAVFLHEVGHGMGVWVARLVLLACLVAHVIATIQLTIQNRSAREQYQNKNTIQATLSSRIMMWTGLTILAFVIYHLLHFTVRFSNSYNDYIDPEYFAETGLQRQDAWKMVIDGFSWFPAVFFYMVALSLLCSHLSHGVSSVFQTLGFRSKKSQDLIRCGGKIYAFVIWAGFMSIPVAIYFFKFGR